MTPTAVEQDQSLSLDPVETPVALPTIEWPASRFYTLAERALKHEGAALGKLADKAAEAGYPREARVIRQDADAIAMEMLPTFKTQGELPLATTDEVAAGIVNELRSLVRRHARFDKAGDVDHEAVLLKELGTRLAFFAQDVAERAYTAGKIVREHEPEVFAIRALPALRRSA